MALLIFAFPPRGGSATPRRNNDRARLPTSGFNCCACACGRERTVRGETRTRLEGLWKGIFEFRWERERRGDLAADFVCRRRWIVFPFVRSERNAWISFCENTFEVFLLNALFMYKMSVTLFFQYII